MGPGAATFDRNALVGNPTIPFVWPEAPGIRRQGCGAPQEHPGPAGGRLGLGSALPAPVRVDLPVDLLRHCRPIRQTCRVLASAWQRDPRDGQKQRPAAVSTPPVPAASLKDLLRYPGSGRPCCPRNLGQSIPETSGLRFANRRCDGRLPNGPSRHRLPGWP